MISWRVGTVVDAVIGGAALQGKWYKVVIIISQSQMQDIIEVFFSLEHRRRKIWRTNLSTIWECKAHQAIAPVSKGVSEDRLQR